LREVLGGRNGALIDDKVLAIHVSLHRETAPNLRDFGGPRFGLLLIVWWASCCRYSSSSSAST